MAQPTSASTAAEPRIPRVDRSQCWNIALSLGYVGSQYKGIQLQNGAGHGPMTETIEGVLLLALDKIGAITLLGANKTQVPKEIKFIRACRTDKGVHAVRNVITLFILRDVLASFHPEGRLSHAEVANDPVRFSECCDAMVARLNAALGPSAEIVVFSAHRVQQQFQPREFCRARVYHYLLPAFALLPNALDSWGSFESQEGVGASHSWVSKAHGEAISSPISAEDVNALEAAVVGDGGVVVSSWNFGTSDHRRDVAATAAKNNMLDILAQKCAEFEKLLEDSYAGVHQFHNFTDDSPQKILHSSDTQSYRTINRIALAKRCVWVRTASDTASRALPHFIVQLEGNSFLLHMIRKMLGTAIAVFRGLARPTMIADALAADKRVSTPMAPGEYLLLSCPSFRAYDARMADVETGKRGVQYPTFAEVFTATQGPVNDFLTSRVYPAIAAVDAAAQISVMTKFVRMLRMHNWSLRVISAPADVSGGGKKGSGKSKRHVADEDGGGDEGDASVIAIDAIADGGDTAAAAAVGEKRKRSEAADADKGPDDGDEGAAVPRIAAFEGGWL